MKISYFHVYNNYNVNTYNISDKKLEIFRLDTDVHYIPSELILILHEQGQGNDEQKNNYYELFYFFNRSNHGKIKIQTDKNLKNYLDIDSFLKSLSYILDKNIL